MNNYEEYIANKRKNNSSLAKLSSNIKPVHIIFLVALFFVGFKIYDSSKNNYIVYILLGAILVIYIISLINKQVDGKTIPRYIAQRIAHEDLKSEVGVNAGYPSGTIINPISHGSHLQYYDSGEGMSPFKWNLAFKIKEPSRPERDIIYKMDPLTGACKGITECLSGFSEEEAKDLKEVYPDTFIKEIGNK